MAGLGAVGKCARILTVPAAEQIANRWCVSGDEKLEDDLAALPLLPVDSAQRIYIVRAAGIDIHGLPGIVVNSGSSSACYRLPSELTGWVAGLLDCDTAGFNLLPERVAFQLVNSVCTAEIL